jgi:predicted permease
MSALLQDLHYSARTLAKSPGFLLVALLSLALGIGANTAIFSFIDAVMLRMLPVANPSQLVFLTEPGEAGIEVNTREHGTRQLLSYPEFDQIRLHNHVLSGLFAAQSTLSEMDLTVARGQTSSSLKARAQLVSGEFFGVLGVQPARGRVFTAAEDTTPGANPVTVISYGLWQRAFAGNPAAIGHIIRVGRADLQIIGIAPPAFHGIIVEAYTDLWIPMSMQQQLLPGRDYLTPRDTLWLQVVGRLAPGMSLPQAQSGINVEFQHVLRAWAPDIPSEEQRRFALGQNIKLQRGSLGASELRDQFADPLLLLMGMVGLVLLIACANIANLMLARATRRQREFGVRVALGAGRSRLVSQVLTESILLAVLGGIAGTLLAIWGTKLLTALVATGSLAVDLDLHPDLPVFAFTALLSLLTGIAFGLAPALRTTQVDVNQTLAANARTSIGGYGKLKTGRALVIAQVSLSLLLLLGATLFIRSLHNMLVANLGYNRDGILLVEVDPVTAGFKPAAMPALYQRILATLRAIPGVRAVSLAPDGLFDGDAGDPISFEGSSRRKPEDLHARWSEVGPGYFSTLGIPLLRGREINAADGAHAAPVCLINAAFARFYFPDSDPIGKHITDEYPTTRETYEIIGVVADAKEHSVAEPTRPRFYPNAFHPIGGAQETTFLLASSNDPAALVSSVRRALHQVDPELPMLSVRTLNEQIDRGLVTERLIAQLSAFFGALALIMAAIGLYGVMSYATSRRTSEIGIRMALGASRSSVLWMVLRETVSLLVIGIAIGLPGAFAASRFISHRLYGITPADPLAIALALCVISSTALLAGFLPARRASRIDPIAALRYD